jgi:ribonuclease HII
LQKARFRCVGRFERDARCQGYRFVAGLDEAGRGSLFGPVFAAAVILSPERPIRGLNDSKILEPELREELASLIHERAVAWAVAAVDAVEIDRINIYRASQQAMKLAVEQLSTTADFLLVDALEIDLELPQQSLICGDARCRSIAAASILAKVHRDECMRTWDLVFPQYGLVRHKGYATPEHRKALEMYGATPFHRFSFEPVRLTCRMSPWAVLGPAEEQLRLWDEKELCH